VERTGRQRRAKLPVARVGPPFTTTLALMKAIRLLLVAAGLAAFAVPAIVWSQAFEITGKPVTMTWPIGNWNGQHFFPRVYCLTYPKPGEALDLTLVMFNRNTLSLARTAYKGNIAIYVATSVMPVGRTPAEEFAIVMETNRRNEVAAPAEVKVSKHPGEFGAIAGLVIRNTVEGDATAPFPFARKSRRPNDGSLRSVSVHRLFARGPDRIEVAGLQYFASPIQGSDEQEGTAHLTEMVEATVKSLQACTATMPVRNR